MSLQNALNDWWNNTDGQHHSLDQAWHIVISHGTLLNSSIDLVAPIKSSATKCAVIESDQPLTEQTACSHGITDSSPRNPGCTNDLAKMYTFRLDAVSAGMDAIKFPTGSNHIVLRDAEFTLKPGINQSQSGAVDPRFIELWGNDIGLDRTYIHGFDPGDSEFGLTSTHGDDIGNGVSFKCVNCWMTNSYMEKIHWWNSESHDIGGGFSTGPYKIVGNWIEGASEALIFGGAAVDINTSVTPPAACTPPQCGPEADVEIRRNRFTHDLNWRTLTGGASNSPSGNYGCAPSCPYKWSLKNNFELKMGQRILVDGNIFENMWPDGQTGEDILTATRTCSGGQQCGVFLPNGLPATVVSDLIFTSDIIRNSVDAFNGNGGGRSGLTPGNGGGVSQGGNRSTHRNLLIYNVGDNNQFGGTSSRAFQIGTAGNDYSCTMSRTTSSGGSGVAKAVCQPSPQCVGAVPNCTSKAGITSLTKNASGVVTMVFSNRQDPLSGATVTVNGAPTGTNGTNFNGTFTITSAGTGLAPPQLTYQLAAGADTSCTTSSSCNAVGATFPTLGTSIDDITVGDFVYVSACTGGVAPLNYQVGATNPGVPAVSPTVPHSLTVYYSNPDAQHPNDNSGTVCTVSNKGGWSQNLAWDHVTVAVPSGIQMQDNFGPPTLPINNQFTNSIYVFNGPNNVNGFYCTGASGSPKEGTVGESCYDSGSRVFHHNVLQGRTGTNYSTYGNSGTAVCSQQGDAGNCFPATATCAGATVSVDGNGHPTCVGFTGFMNGVAFPTSFCTSPASAPSGCLLMSPPYGTFDYHQLSLTGNSTNNPYKSGGIDDASDGKDMGPDIGAIDTALTRTQYVCTGTCGTPGPFPD